MKTLVELEKKIIRKIIDPTLKAISKLGTSIKDSYTLD